VTDAYPLHLDLHGKRVLVVGAGPVGVRRSRGVAAAGALVTIIAPDAPEDLELPVLRRRFEEADVEGSWLVLACTGVVDDAVARACEARGIWCVRADDASRSAAWVPAVARQDDVVVSVTAGRDPRRAMALRDAIALGLETGGLPLRRTRVGEGSVALVGGGPGDPGLLTVRGRQLLAAADVVVRDRLAPAVEVAPGVEVLETGKQAHGPSWSQSDIEQLMVVRALEGKRVVRLKGGDVHLFGRGIEEVAACVNAGVAVEVVPGVSSAFAAPAWAGIPVTAKGLTQSVSVVSAHLAPGAEGSTVDWDALARLGGTLVLLMAVERLAQCAAALVAGGRSRETPVAVIRDGTLPSQEVVVSTLGTVAVDAAGVSAPAVVVVGEVVSARLVP
jgi:uroporphyrin-III C-methyltransferase/precorrin-2 dehydrogenase/sirohydrochlorin ferrochelatase